jgi:hypothetical protein
VKNRAVTSKSVTLNTASRQGFSVIGSTATAGAIAATTTTEQRMRKVNKGRTKITCLVMVYGYLVLPCDGSVKATSSALSASIRSPR